MIVRITLALLFVVPAAMAYPWQSTADRWLLGVAIAVTVVLFAWWRGLFVTTMLHRRLAMLRRRNHSQGSHQSSEFATVVLRVETPRAATLPLDLVAGYLERYGISFDKVRVTSRDGAGARTTWVTLTLAAVDNISALSARSPRIPLLDTASLAARRLADHLRELGFQVSVVDDVESPLAGKSKETWRAVSDERGYLAAYRLRVDSDLAENLAAVWAGTADEVWTALEFTGSRTHPAISVACAVRTADRSASRAPLPGLVSDGGVQRPVLLALAPDSDERLPAVPVAVPHGLLATLQWRAGSALSRT